MHLPTNTLAPRYFVFAPLWISKNRVLVEINSTTKVTWVLFNLAHDSNEPKRSLSYSTKKPS